MKELSGWIYRPEWEQHNIEWKFFNGDKNRLSIIYGKNGSGKTTFSEAVYSYSHSVTNSNFFETNPIDSKGNVIEINKNNVFIFNEDFINNTIGFKEGTGDSLTAIVMFGDSKNIDEEITKTRNKNKELDDERKRLDIEKYETKGSGSCLSELLDVVNDNLKKNWAIRDKEIKGHVKASRLPENLLDEIRKTILSSSYKKELDSYNELIKEYNLSKQYNESLNNIPISSINLKQEESLMLSNLLQVNIPMPMTGELEKKVLEELNNDSSGQTLNNIEALFSSSKSYCPLCFQEISTEHKKSLRKAFNNVVNRETKEHQSSLEKSLIKEIEIDCSIYNGKLKNEDILIDFEKCLNSINNLINEINQLAKNKINNPYKPIYYKKEDEIINEYEKLVNKAMALNNEIEQFNINVKNSESLKKKLDSINLQLSAHEINSSLKQYELNEAAYKTAKMQYGILTNSIEQNEKKLNSLMAQSKNTGIALNQINNDLKRAFGTDKCIQLWSDVSGNYRIKSHGHPVKLSNVSVGERNAIAISYFFSKLKQNEKQGEEFRNPLYVVIDDPISSFDRDNKIGVLTLIKYNIKKIIRGNAESKVLVLTHDLMCVEHLSKGLNKIAYENNHVTEKLKVAKFIINQEKNLEAPNQSPSQYQSWLEDVFEYAQKSPTEIENDVSRQNEMRRILEAYFTFNYGGGFDAKLSNEDILKRIKDEELREYFEECTFKIGLNAGSHSEQSIKYEDDGPFGYYLDGCSCNEKIRLARDLLCLLFSLDDLHVVYLLSKAEADETKIRNIFSKWIADIRMDIKGDQNSETEL